MGLDYRHRHVGVTSRPLHQQQQEQTGRSVAERKSVFGGTHPIVIPGYQSGVIPPDACRDEIVVPRGGVDEC